MLEDKGALFWYLCGYSISMMVLTDNMVIINKT